MIILTLPSSVGGSFTANGAGDGREHNEGGGGGTAKGQPSSFRQVRRDEGRH